MSGVTVSLSTTPDIQNYADLTSAINKWMDRDDLGDEMGTFTRLVESEINRRLSRNRVRPSLNTASYTTDGDLPVRYLTAVDMIMIRDGYNYRLEEIDISKAALIKARNQDLEQPDYLNYAVIGNKIEFIPALKGGDQVVFTYIEQLQPLNEVQTQNWMLNNHPDVYLYGCLAHAAAYEVDDGRGGQWLSLFDDLLNSAIDSYPVHDNARLSLDSEFPILNYHRHGRSW